MSCNCDTKPTAPTKTAPDTRTDERTMEDRFGSGYSITQIGLVATRNRFSETELVALRKGHAGRKGPTGKAGLRESKPSAFRKCPCGAPGKRGLDG